MVGQDDFFNKLLGETYSLIDGEVAPSPVEKLADYFDKKYADTHELKNKINQLYFNENLNIFRMRHQNSWIDFPANWSIFAKLSHNLQLNLKVKILIDHDHPDKLCQILNLSKEEVIQLSVRNGAVLFEVSKFQNHNQAA